MCQGAGQAPNRPSIRHSTAGGRSASASRSPAAAGPRHSNGPGGRCWGGSDGPGYQWPDSNHGLNIDSRGNIWIGGNGAMDGHVLKFTLDGKFVMQVGKKGVTRDSLAQDHFFQVAKTFFYSALVVEELQ